MTSADAISGLRSMLHEWFAEEGCSHSMAAMLAIEWADRIVEEEEAIGGTLFNQDKP